MWGKKTVIKSGITESMRQTQKYNTSRHMNQDNENLETRSQY